MIQFALSGILIGANLGARFTVFALVPVIICAIIIAGAKRSAQGCLHWG